MAGVKVVEKSLRMKRGGKDGYDVIEVAPEPKRCEGEIRRDRCSPKVGHEDVGIGRGKGGAHSSSTDLKKVRIFEPETVLGEDQPDQS